MSENTLRYQLPYLSAAQAQKHVTLNESLRMLDVLTNLELHGLDVTDPPSAPDDGTCLYLADEPTGEFTYQGNKLAVWVDQAWMFFDPFDGLTAFDTLQQEFIRFEGGEWSPAVAPIESLEKLGINTQADTTNRLSVKSDSILLTTDDQAAVPTGDMRLAVNKTSGTDTASLLFQTGYSGRAEIGCTGSDNLSIKVSPDGISYQTAMEFDQVNGNVGIGAPPTNAFSINKHEDNTVSRLRVRNTSDVGASGAAIDVVASNGQLAQFIQYANNVAYLTTNSSNLFFQTSAASGRTRIYAGSDLIVGFETSKIECRKPVKLQSSNVADLPSAATSGAGAILYVPDEVGGAVLAFSDGSSWRRSTDRQVVA